MGGNGGEAASASSPASSVLTEVDISVKSEVASFFEGCSEGLFAVSVLPKLAFFGDFWPSSLDKSLAC